MFRSLDIATYSQASAAELAKGVIQGHISPVNLAELALALYDRFNQAFKTHTYLSPVELLQQAESLEREAITGRIRGPLHGVPVAVTDTYALAGMPTTFGSQTNANKVTDYSTRFAKCVVDAGALVFGKTVTSEHAWSLDGYSPLNGNPGNPWNPEYIAGGCFGSASALVCRMAPVAITVDTGGNTRLPAAFCGLFGYKPAYGRIGTWPQTTHEMLVHHSVLTRRVEDAALLLEIGKGPDSRDPYCLPSTHPSLAMDTGRSTKMRCGYVRTPFGIPPASEIDRKISETLEVLRAAGTIELVDVSLFGPPPAWIFEVFCGASRVFAELDLVKSRADEMDPKLVQSTLDAQRIGVSDYMRAKKARCELFAQVNAAIASCHVLLMPTSQIMPFKHGQAPDDPQVAPIYPWLAWAAYMYPFNITGHPAASINCGLGPSGFPIGLQIVGPRFGDDIVLAMAAEFERVLNLSDVKPELVAATVAEMQQSTMVRSQ